MSNKNPFAGSKVKKDVSVEAPLKKKGEEGEDIEIENNQVSKLFNLESQVDEYKRIIDEQDKNLNVIYHGAANIYNNSKPIDKSLANANGIIERIEEDHGNAIIGVNLAKIIDPLAQQPSNQTIVTLQNFKTNIETLFGKITIDQIYPNILSMKQDKDQFSNSTLALAQKMGFHGKGGQITISKATIVEMFKYLETQFDNQNNALNTKDTQIVQIKEASNQLMLQQRNEWNEAMRKAHAVYSDETEKLKNNIKQKESAINEQNGQIIVYGRTDAHNKEQIAALTITKSRLELEVQQLKPVQNQLVLAKKRSEDLEKINKELVLTLQKEQENNSLVSINTLTKIPQLENKIVLYEKDIRNKESKLDELSNQIAQRNNEFTRYRKAMEKEKQENVSQLLLLKEEVSKRDLKYNELVIQSKSNESTGSQYKGEYDKMKKAQLELIEKVNQYELIEIPKLQREIERLEKPLLNKSNSALYYQELTTEVNDKGDNISVFHRTDPRTDTTAIEIVQQSSTTHNNIYELVNSYNDVVNDRKTISKEYQSYQESVEFEKGQATLKLEQKETELESQNKILDDYKKFIDEQSMKTTPNVDSFELNNNLQALQDLKHRILMVLNYTGPFQTDPTSSGNLKKMPSDQSIIHDIKQLSEFRRQILLLSVSTIEINPIMDMISLNGNLVRNVIKMDDNLWDGDYSFIKHNEMLKLLGSYINSLKSKYKNKSSSSSNGGGIVDTSLKGLMTFGNLTYLLSGDAMTDRNVIKKTHKLSHTSPKYSITLKFYAYDTLISSIVVKHVKVQMINNVSKCVIDFDNLPKGSHEMNSSLCFRHIYRNGEVEILINSLSDDKKKTPITFRSVYAIPTTFNDDSYDSLSLTSFMNQNGTVIDLYHINKASKVKMDLMLINEDW